MPLSSYADACVVIVDDQPANVLVLDRVIKGAGLTEVHAVTDPRQAVDRCHEVDADLVLLDLQMPHIDGFAVLSELRSSMPADAFLPVVVLTSDATIETRDRALEAGATDFLTKPFDHTEVVLRIRNLLETRTLHRGLQQHATMLQAHLDALQEDARRRTDHRQMLSERIDRTIAGHTIEMVFQPVAELSTGNVIGVEALARFPAEPIRPPNEWFDEAATVGRGTELELTAARAALSRTNDLPGECFLAINLSPSVVLDPELKQVLAAVPADRLVLEITEHAAVQDYGELLACLDELRAAGIRIAVDDAGAGFAGLNHILRLRPDILKLDITLTTDIDTDPARRALGTALVSFAQEIKAVIIAEGIETANELTTLRSLGIRWGQGYHLARPGPLPLPR